MNILINKKRAQRVRKRLKNINTTRFRLSVYRSTKNISAQIIDDKVNKTLVSATSVGHKVTEKNKKSNLFIHTAELLAKKALEKKITKVYFDRGKYKYHGNIKKFADILRKNGIDF